MADETDQAKEASDKVAEEEASQAKSPYPTRRYRVPDIDSKYRPVNRWLLVVYAALIIWGVVYLIINWGGLGPGLAG